MSKKDFMYLLNALLKDVRSMQSTDVMNVFVYDTLDDLITLVWQDWKGFGRRAEFSLENFRHLERAFKDIERRNSIAPELYIKE